MFTPAIFTRNNNFWRDPFEDFGAFFPAFFAPACMVLLWSLFIEPVFGKLGGGLKSGVPEENPSEDDLTES